MRRPRLLDLLTVLSLLFCLGSIAMLLRGSGKATAIGTFTFVYVNVPFPVALSAP